MIETPPLPAIDEIDDEQIQREKDYISSLLRSASASYHLTRGAIHDLVVKPMAVISASLRADAEQFRNSFSLKLLSENPDQASDETVDLAAQNYRITRRPGGSAAGSLAIVVSDLIPVTIPKGAVFIGPASQRFLSDEAYTAKTSEDLVTDQFDVLMRPRTGGGYVFNIDVTAESAGSAGMARRGDQFTPESGLPGVASAYADEDFSGGLDPQSNAELASLLQTGMSINTVTTQPGIESVLRSNQELIDIYEVSLIGMNDPEQQRYHAPAPIAYGGRLDVWIKSQPVPQTVSLLVEATLEEKLSNGTQRWSVDIPREDAAGVYRVTEINRSQENSSEDLSLDPESYTLGVDFSDDDFTPDITSGAEAAYTRYQTINLKFIDSSSSPESLTVGDKAEYTLRLWKMPLIDVAQDYMADPSILPETTDIVVRGAVPAVLDITINVSRRTGSQIANEAEVASSVAEHVQQLGFVGRVTASELSSAAYDSLPDGYVVDKVEIACVVYRPDGTRNFIRSLEKVEIPDEPELLVTQKTTFFVLEQDSVTVNIDS